MKTRWTRIVAGLAVVLAAAAFLWWSSRGEDKPRQKLADTPAQYGSEDTKKPSRLEPGVDQGEALRPPDLATVPQEPKPKGPVTIRQSAAVEGETDASWEEVDVAVMETIYQEMLQLGSSPTPRPTGFAADAINVQESAPPAEPEPLVWEEGTTEAQKHDALRQMLVTALDEEVNHPKSVEFVLGGLPRRMAPWSVRHLHKWAHGEADWVPRAPVVKSLGKNPTTYGALLLKLVAEDNDAARVSRIAAVRTLSWIAQSYDWDPIAGIAMPKADPPSDTMKQYTYSALQAVAAEASAAPQDVKGLASDGIAKIDAEPQSP